MLGEVVGLKSKGVVGRAMIFRAVTLFPVVVSQQVRLELMMLYALLELLIAGVFPLTSLQSVLLREIRCLDTSMTYNLLA